MLRRLFKPKGYKEQADETKPCKDEIDPPQLEMAASTSAEDEDSESSKSLEEKELDESEDEEEEDGLLDEEDEQDDDDVVAMDAVLQVMQEDDHVEKVPLVGSGNAKSVRFLYGPSTKVVTISANGKPGLAYSLGVLLALYATKRLAQVRSFVGVGLANLLLVLMQQARKDMVHFFRDNYAVAKGDSNDTIQQEAEEWHWRHLLSGEFYDSDHDVLTKTLLPRVRKLCTDNVEYLMVLDASTNVLSCCFGGKNNTSSLQKVLTKGVLDHDAMVQDNEVTGSMTQPRFYHVVSQENYTKPLVMVNYKPGQKDPNSPVVLMSAVDKPLAWLAAQTCRLLRMDKTSFTHNGIKRTIKSGLHVDPLGYTASQHAYEVVRAGQPDVLRKVRNTLDQKEHEEDRQRHLNIEAAEESDDFVGSSHESETQQDSEDDENETKEVKEDPADPKEKEDEPTETAYDEEDPNDEPDDSKYNENTPQDAPGPYLEIDSDRPCQKLYLIDAWTGSMAHSTGISEAVALAENQLSSVNGSPDQPTNEHLRCVKRGPVSMFDCALDSIPANASAFKGTDLQSMRNQFKRMESRGLKAISHDQFDLAYAYGFLSTLHRYEPKENRKGYISQIPGSKLVQKYGLEQLFLED